MSGSKQERGDENLKIILEYLNNLKATGKQFRLRNGRPDIAAISQATGLDRQVFYRNKRIALALKDFVGICTAAVDSVNGSCGRCDAIRRKRDSLQRNYESLQEKYVERDTELQELRKKLMQQEAAEGILTSGRRWIP